MENLVFEGGGILGAGFIGSIRYLEENDLLKNVKRVIGTSAGSMAATAVALNVNSYDLQSYMLEDFNQFKDKDWGLFRNIYRFVRNSGLYKGDKMYEWFGKILKKHTGNADITFKEVFYRFDKELVITGTNLDKVKIVYFNKDDYPNMPVRKALRISMSIPYIFQSVKFDNDTWVDGGVLDNYPFWYFNNSSKTLGFKLMGEEEKRDDIIIYKDKDVNHIFDASFLIIQSLLKQLERTHVREDFWKKTITINTGNMSSIDFGLSKEKKLNLIELAFRTTQKYFEQKMTNEEFLEE